MATTPCPHCAVDVPIPEAEHGECPGCGQALRFVEVPETECVCGAAVPLPPQQDVVRCSCGRAHATDPARPLRHVAACPRCRRDIDVDGEASQWTCPHCQTPLRLHGTL